MGGSTRAEVWIERGWRRAVESVSASGQVRAALLKFGSSNSADVKRCARFSAASASGERGLFGGCMMIAQAGEVLLLCRRSCMRWIVSSRSGHAEGEGWCRRWSFSIVWTADTPRRARMLRGAARCCCGEPSERKSVQERSHARRWLLLIGERTSRS